MADLVDWSGDASHVFSNLRMTHESLPSDWPEFKTYRAHIWLTTSGTSRAKGDVIWCALSKNALLASADAVNAHLEATSSDIWLNPLPEFHVGGLSIWARAFTSGAKVVPWHPLKWDPVDFIRKVDQESPSLCSLVPTQLFDLVSKGFKAPSSLRAVIIGGSALSDGLYEDALNLSWPILPSYGFTECSSQVATATLSNPRLKILPHVECTQSEDGALRVKSRALLTGHLRISQSKFLWKDPKVEGTFLTDDLVELKGGYLKPLGRRSDMIKIGGEKVSLFDLEKLWSEIKPKELDAVIIAKEDDRLGACIELVTLNIHRERISSYVNIFNEVVMPFARIRSLRFVVEIPRTPLGKVMKALI